MDKATPSSVVYIPAVMCAGPYNGVDMFKPTMGWALSQLTRNFIDETITDAGWMCR